MRKIIRKTIRLLGMVFLLAMLFKVSTVSAQAYEMVSIGQNKEDVKVLQKMLNQVSKTALVVDGKFGAATELAVKNFQKAYGLAQDGIVGPATWSVLEKYYEASLKPASTLTISGGKYPNELLKQGGAYSIEGKISSNYNITSVTVGIYTGSGAKTSQIQTVTPNATSYNISSIDRYIKFGALSKGSYIFKVSATDASGMSKTLVSLSFRVTSADEYSLLADGAVKLSKNFIVSEFRCKDGSDVVWVDEKLVEYLQKIRDHFGKAVTINSAYRTIVYNKAVGGGSNSWHLYGSAADICISGVSPSEIAKYAEKIGVKGIGLYGTFVHIDTRDAKTFWKNSEQVPVKTFQ